MYSKLVRMKNFYDDQSEEFLQKIKSIKDMERIFDACVDNGIDSMEQLDEMFISKSPEIQQRAQKVANVVNHCLKSKYIKVKR